MFTLLLVALAAFLISYVLTPLVRSVFLRLGWVDLPDGGRKIHLKPIPRAGGIAIFIAYLGAYAFLAAMYLSGWTDVHIDLGLFWRVLPGATLLFVVGLLDDRRGLNPWMKLVAQVFAALIAYAGGLHVEVMQWSFVEKWWWSLPLTVFWLVLSTNAFNLIDGMDGLSSGLGLCATLTLICAASLDGNYALLLATVPLAGALLGFLRYNFSPASVFLGDGGSYMIGFLLGCFGVVWGQKTATLLGLTAPLMASSVPLLDVCLVVVRRFLRQRPLFGADRLHVHHRLLDRGLTPRCAVLVLYGAASLAAVFSLLSTLVHERYTGLILVLFCGVVGFAIQSLEYAEIDLAGQMILQGAFRRALGSELILRKAQQNLRSANTPDACWEVFRTAAREMGFCRAYMMLEEAEFRESFEQEDHASAWTIMIPLGGVGRLELAHQSKRSSTAAAVVSLAEALRTRLVSTRIEHKVDAVSHSRQVAAGT